VTVKVAFWPAANVVGSDRPESLNSVLLEVTDEMVTLDPLAVRVLVKFFVAPTVTLPKLKLDGLAVSWPVAVPVPLIASASVGFGAFEVKVKVPLAEPAAAGANVAVKVKLCPAVS